MAKADRLAEAPRGPVRADGRTALRNPAIDFTALRGAALSHGWGFAHMFVMLSGFNALYAFFTALIQREKFNARTLNHYDEALGMAALCLIARLFI